MNYEINIFIFINYNYSKGSFGVVKKIVDVIRINRGKEIK